MIILILSHESLYLYSRLILISIAWTRNYSLLNKIQLFAVLSVLWFKFAVESTKNFLNKRKQQQVTGMEDNNLTSLKQVLDNQNGDYQNAAMDSIPGLIIFEVFVMLLLRISSVFLQNCHFNIPTVIPKCKIVILISLQSNCKL